MGKNLKEKGIEGLKLKIEEDLQVCLKIKIKKKDK